MRMLSMSGSGCGVPSRDLSQHQYGGGAYQSLKLQFRNSSSPSKAAHGLEGILGGKGRLLQSHVQPLLAGGCGVTADGSGQTSNLGKASNFFHVSSFLGKFPCNVREPSETLFLLERGNRFPLLRKVCGSQPRPRPAKRIPISFSVLHLNYTVCFPP